MGGLTAGLALARHGYSVDILEKDSEAGQMDKARHNVGLWSPSLACLERLGVLGGLDLAEADAHLRYVVADSVQVRSLAEADAHLNGSVGY